MKEMLFEPAVESIATEILISIIMKIKI